MVAMPAAIAVVAAVVMAVSAIVMSPRMMALVMTVTTALVLREFDTALGLAQAGKAGRRRRCRCGRTAEGRSQSQNTDKYEAFHPRVSPSYFRLWSGSAISLHSLRRRRIIAICCISHLTFDQGISAAKNNKKYSFSNSD